MLCYGFAPLTCEFWLLMFTAMQNSDIKALASVAAVLCGSLEWHVTQDVCNGG